MIRRRNLFFLAIGAIGLLSAVAIFMMMNPEPRRITKRQYEQIEVGMRIEDVERITGMKRDENIDNFRVEDYAWRESDGFGRMPSHYFFDDNACITVWVDQDGIVDYKDFVERRPFWHYLKGIVY